MAESNWLFDDAEDNRSYGTGSSSGEMDDYDLQMAQRDREKYEEGIRGQAMLHAMEEVAGELYLAVYQEKIKKTMREYQERWNVKMPTS